MRDLSLHILDILQNSIAAKSKTIRINIIAVKDILAIEILDDGIGMDEGFLKQVTDPFTTTRTTRKVGLGIPLLKLSAEMAAGEFNIMSTKGVGTSVKASFKISNVDRLPLGDIAQTVISVIVSYPDIDMCLYLSSEKESFTLDTVDIKNRIAGISIDNLDVINWIKEYIEEGVKTIFGGVLDEILS